MTAGNDVTTAAGDDAPETAMEADRVHHPVPPGSPTELPAADRGRRRRVSPDTLSSGLPHRTPLLVAGGCGGAGGSTLAWGIASAMAAASPGEVFPVVVDATPAGGDLTTRAADGYRPLGSMQSWLASTQPSLPSMVAAACGRTTTGVGLLARDQTALPRRESLLSVHRHLRDAGSVPVYDGGAPLSSRLIRPLLGDPTIPVAVAVTARPDAVNRLLPVLEWLADECGEFVVGDCALVVTQQSPYPLAGVVEHLATHLGQWVRGVYEIGYDPHLAEGALLRWDRLAHRTRLAYTHLLEELQR